MEPNEIKHTCNICDIVRISDTQTVYLCTICKRKVAIVDKENFGIDIVVILDLSDNQEKIYPDKNQKINEENLKEWV